ncbi:alpha/beta hydrolase [Dyella halodurans]|uniref:Alpha/beta fold hydrolase n=1 Tax=Dyella halodurans TaxID=1920171 RepID=A0ABV9C8C7_9GAMM|nr:alpha/beta hydrolase [Dyella halodurans]
MDFPGSFFVIALAMAPAAHSPTSEAFTEGADGVRIHYLEAGPPHASRNLLLIPGWRVSARIWTQQIDYFAAKGFHVIAMDPRSQGQSTIAASGNTPENRAQDVDRVISNLKLAHLTLVGWSQGAQDVAAYVAQFGTVSVDKLVLVDSPVSAGPADVTESSGMVKQVLQGLGQYARAPEAYSKGMMQAIMQAPPAPLTFDTLTTESLKTPVDTGISMLVSDILTTDRRPSLKKFDKPTLVIASGESLLMDAQKAMAKALPKSQFISVDHARHAVFVDAPDDFNRALMRFIESPTLDRNSPGPSS